MSTSLVHVPLLETYCQPYMGLGVDGYYLFNLYGNVKESIMAAAPLQHLHLAAAGPLTPVCHVIKRFRGIVTDISK